MRYSYAIEKLEENVAKVVGKDLGISTKAAVEICNFIKNKNVQNAKKVLERVLEKKQAVPYKRSIRDLGHKAGEVGPGRYPQIASKEILKLVKSVEANALFKGLNTQNLVIVHACAKKASEPWRYGRHRRRKMKRCHVELAVIEQKPKEEKKE